jgi:predicted AlkP superfamily pyrophosphatase or phosphodiesterase
MHPRARLAPKQELPSQRERHGGGWRAVLWLAIALTSACSSGPSAPAGRSADGLGVISELSSAAPGRPDHVLLISIAGLTPDLYLDAETPMPILADLARAGVAAEFVEAVVPATAYPVHTSFVTGRPANEHGVPADQMLGERGVRRARYWHASYVRGPTLWQGAVDAGIGVAALDWPATVGAAIPLLIPDIMPTRRGERWLDLLTETSTPSLLALALRSPQELAGGGIPGPDRDALFLDVACKLIASASPPGLMLLRLTQADPAQLAFGPDSEEALRAFARIDAELGELLVCLEDAGVFPRTAIVVLGDRVLLPVHTVVHPNFALAEAGLVSRNASGNVEIWSALARSNGGSAFVYARDERSALAARAALEVEARRSGAYRIVSADEMIRREADSEAWFGLEARAGFAFDNAARGPLLRLAVQRAAAGYLESPGRRGPGFAAYGRGVRRNLRIPEVSQLDIAPTIAELLGIDLPATRRRGFVGILHLSNESGAGWRRDAVNRRNSQ